MMKNYKKCNKPQIRKYQSQSAIFPETARLGTHCYRQGSKGKYCNSMVKTNLDHLTFLYIGQTRRDSTNTRCLKKKFSCMFELFPVSVFTMISTEFNQVYKGTSSEENCPWEKLLWGFYTRFLCFYSCFPTVLGKWRLKMHRNKKINYSQLIFVITSTCLQMYSP